MAKGTSLRIKSVAKIAAEVPLQVTIPLHVKKSLDVKAVLSGRTRRALVLEGLKSIGVEVSKEEIAGRRGSQGKQRKIADG